MKPIEVGKHLVVDPRIGHGQLKFKGTRTLVRTVLAELAKGRPMRDVLASRPQLTRRAVKEAVLLAAAALFEKYQLPPEALDENLSLEEACKYEVKVGKYLTVHPRCYHGEMTFQGTRVPVKTPLNFLAYGETIDRILRGWPHLPREAIVESIRLATTALLEKYQPPAEAVDASVRTGRSA